jgi:hypothetical protein
MQRLLGGGTGRGHARLAAARRVLHWTLELGPAAIDRARDGTARKPWESAAAAAEIPKRYL